MSSAKGCETQGRPFVMSVCSELKLGLAYRVDCGMWACSFCGPRMAARWVSRAQYGVFDLLKRGLECCFVTLTFPGYLDAVETLSRWRQCWPKMIQAVRRKVSQLFYFYVHERHEDDRLHLHLLVSPYIKTRWWKDNAVVRGFGFIADSEPVFDAGGAARYVGKYLFKAADSQWPAFWRRVGKSRNWPLREKERDGWEHHFMKKEYEVLSVMALAVSRGYKVALLQGSEARRVMRETKQ